MALTKVTNSGITNDAVDGDKLKDGSITTAKIGASAVESSEINDGTVTADDLASTLDLSPKSVTLSGATIESLKRPVQDNIALLGFKMAVNDGLTVFNLVDGIVDEFHDESGTDEAEGSNDLYCASNDYYINSTSPTGVSQCISAGYGLENHITNTGQIASPAATSSQLGSPVATGTMGTFTVPSGMTSVSIKVFGAAGGGDSPADLSGGGGGFSKGCLAVSGGQTLYVIPGLGGQRGGINGGVPQFLGGGASPIVPGAGPQGPKAGSGGGLSGVFNADLVPLSNPQYSAPQAYIIAGSGGGGSGNQEGGYGGGLTGNAGGPNQSAQQTNAGGDGCRSGGGGDQEQGGQASGGSEAPGCAAGTGALFEGGVAGKYPSLCAVYGGGGAGYYGGGGGGRTSGPSSDGSGGGGSSYYGHPQISNGDTEAGNESESGGDGDPFYPQIDGSPHTCGALGESSGYPGYVFISGSAPASTTSTTIISNAFTSTSVPTSSRIVVFEENVASPTLNTDIIASISRDGGSNFTTATLSDSGYVTGSSGQRILTGTATISGQPSGQSMRWKLALANNTVKIHGVALQWS